MFELVCNDDGDFDELWTATGIAPTNPAAECQWTLLPVLSSGMPCHSLALGAPKPFSFHVCVFDGLHTVPSPLCCVPFVVTTVGALGTVSESTAVHNNHHRTRAITSPSSDPLSLPAHAVLSSALLRLTAIIRADVAKPASISSSGTEKIRICC